jgi:hypothetical protein
MGQERESIFTDNIEPCEDWAAVTRQFDLLPKPVLRRDEGELFEQGWIFRGHKRANYPLQPSIERIEGSYDWAEAEHRVLAEFQSKAPLHMDPRQLSPATSEHKLGWLATMQHYGAPTRLLDFTYSPYIALYFALRNFAQSKRLG